MDATADYTSSPYLSNVDVSEFKTRHFVPRKAPNQALQGFATRSNVSSR